MFPSNSQNTTMNNPFKRPSSNYIHQRPQTPVNNLQQNNFPQNRPLTPNRSFSKLQTANQFQQPIYNNQRSNVNISKSRVSVNSSSSQLAFLNNDQADIFPQDLVFLLKNQQKNINNFKQKIERQKNKVQNDFSVFKTQIEHVLEDVKISVQAELDLVYKTFITKYAELKGEVQELRQMRKQILMNNLNLNGGNFAQLNMTSNKDLISQIQRDAQQFRNYKVYGYLSQLQKQKLTPILGLSNDLILIGSADCPFYRNKQMNQKLKDIRQSFHGMVTDVYTQLNQYVITPQAIIQKQKLQEQNTNNILRQMNEIQNFNNEQSKINMFDAHYPINMPQKQFAKFDNHSQQQKFQNKPNNHNQPNNNNNNKPNQKSSKLQFVMPNQQSAVTRYGQTVSFNHMARIVTDHNDAILCVFFIGDKQIATGSKDKTINIYSLDGSKTATLRGHDAPICSLSQIKGLNGQRYLASGGDHGCNSLILWNTKTWVIHSKIQNHTAAVTGIVDLQDGRHLVTGSYDKKIYFFSHAKSKLISTISNNKASVSSLIMSGDKTRLIASGLDNSLSVWSIHRKNDIVQSITPELSISNNAMICELQPCILKPENVFGATRDGNIRLFNIVTGQIVKSYTVNSNTIIQMAVIERQMKPEGPFVLSCSSKDNSLVLTKMDTGISSLIKLKHNTGIQFGCGIGPKVVFNTYKGGMVAILNQSNTSRQFSLYQVQIK